MGGADCDGAVVGDWVEVAVVESKRCDCLGARDGRMWLQLEGLRARSRLGVAWCCEVAKPRCCDWGTIEMAQ